MLSHTEENYLKEIYKIIENEGCSASTNAIAQRMNTAAASVTDMMKRLSEKQLIHYEKYKGVLLSDEGNRVATQLIRKHRLWEVFLLQSLHFAWDEVHELAEQLEHIQSEELINRLDSFLKFPKFDPHGDPIPDANGNYTLRKQLLIKDLELHKTATVVGVNEHSSSFLQYLNRINLTLGAKIMIQEHFEYDGSKFVSINDEKAIIVSGKICENVFVMVD
jgi:DtxR family transcriptional regulator, Mn-dependent transcriptional regulator